jgi:N-acetylgalactosamine-6-sulfatase
MNRSAILFSCVCWVAALGAAGAAPPEATSRPNVVFLLADDLGWGDLGCHGHPYIRTPNLDRLAASGTRFEQFYVSASVCHPSRSCFMTGRFCATGFGDVHPDGGGRINVSLVPGTVPLPRLLKGAGYVTAHVGKWHLNTDGLRDPGRYGLDFMQSHGRTDLGKFRAEMKERNGQDQALARAAIDFMKRHRDRSFYLQLWFTVPHSPVRPSAEELKAYASLRPRLDDFTGFTRAHFATRPDFADQMRAWCAQITGHDRVVGEVLDAIDSLGLTKDTLVFYTSDNGPAPPAPEPGRYVEEKNAMGSAGPWRARKNTYYEGGIRVPAIVRWPGRVPAGRVDKESVWAAADWLPTVCRLAGVDPAAAAPDGWDVSDVWRGAVRPCDRELVWGRNPRVMAIRDGNWKLHEGRNGVELYDLQKDPAERDDLSQQFPEVTKRLRERLAGWREKLVATLKRGEAGVRVGKPDAAGN